MTKLAIASVCVGVVLLAAGAMTLVRASQHSSKSISPVIVELFTSEGCSSCPPADALLQKLVRTQPVSGAHIIALEEHVDYWDHLGWRDPYSSPEFTNRQNDYANAFHDSDVYTPEMVVNGRWGFVGSDMAQAYQRIFSASQSNSNRLMPTIEQNGKSVSVTLNSPAGNPSSHLLIAITQDNLSSNVTDGENEDKTLTHIATVRQIADLGSVKSGPNQYMLNSFQATGTGLHAVAFVQENSSRRIIGASQFDLN